MAARIHMAAKGPLAAPPKRETVGKYVGLCVLVQFPDVPATILPEDVSAFCNNKGYGGFGNRGSVRDYFEDVSAGRLQYTNTVTPITLPSIRAPTTQTKTLISPRALGS
jgi:hypothetical protein